ncbi:MAG: hypothetical protein GY937_21500 [bacterium]|nr:hypothetical protein [bacterium]
MDRRTGGNPAFALRGIPGTVGSGTRELWKELRAASSLNSAFSLWPFDGSIADLTRSAEVVLGEVYPRAAYALALSAQLPTQPRDVAKTKRGAREHAIEELKNATWPARAGLRLPDLKPSLDSEDDFDALMVAVALVRLLHEGIPLSHELVDPRFEGGILGTGGIEFSRRSAQPRPHFSKASRSPAEAPSKRDLPCPIPGCDKIFRNSRGGWDAHVASPKQHVTWRDGERDPERLKARFREEFPDWF